MNDPFETVMLKKEYKHDRKMATFFACCTVATIIMNILMAIYDQGFYLSWNWLFYLLMGVFLLLEFIYIYLGMRIEKKLNQGGKS